LNTDTLKNLDYEITIELNEKIREIFEKTEDLMFMVKKAGVVKYTFEDETTKTAIIDYRLKRKLYDKEKDYLVGLRLVRDDVTSILEMLKTGEKIRQVEVDCMPYTVRSNQLPSITLIIGKTGSGKTVHGLNLINVLCNDKYTVYDISMNIERPGEMIFSCMPLNEKYYKKEYNRLYNIQGMTPKKLNMYILIPYFKTKLLPKHLPSCSRVITVPLYTLANKPYALSLLFTKKPDTSVVELINLILSNFADKTWDLDTLKLKLKGLLEEKQPYIWIREEIGDLKYEREVKLDKKVIKKALSLLVPVSTLISSGETPTAINFNELTKPGVFVTIYMGHVPDRITAFYFITWFFYALMDYKTTHPEKKIAIFINEAQNIAPSQQLIGGIYSSEKYGLAVDIVSSCLQWRGMGFKSIILTQEQSQLKHQLRSQAGLIIVFHTTNEDDLKFAFGDILNQELKENLKMLVTNRFFKDEHLCIYKWGPEDVQIVSSAMPPFAVELENMNPFDLYAKLYPTDTVSLSSFIKQIEISRQKTIQSLKDRFGSSIRIITSGKRIVELEPDEITIKQKQIDEMLAGATGGTVITDGTVITHKDKVLPEGKIPISEEDFKLIKSINETQNLYELLGLKMKRARAKEGGGAVKIIATIVKYLIFGTKNVEFKYFPTSSKKLKGKEKYISLQEILNRLGFNYSKMRIWTAMNQARFFQFPLHGISP
jgi:hypothetical protein